ncbi:hypothetical protein [Luteitalea sp.]|jgi:hypothetical protein|uniref:hypothetical protein n=1 Tax=Luteitalea sp. TaxID=2004800 RepID=UPI0025C434A6|nr:hypothetical protein [Luteitalea sp.]
MRAICLSLVIVLVTTARAHAQITVTDVAVTTQSRITAVLKEYLQLLQRDEHSQLRRMAQRLSMFTDLGKFGVPDAPRWRIHDFEDPRLFHFSRAYNAALNYGDASGLAYLGVSHPLVPAATLVGRLPATARRALAARLATVQASDAAIITATHQSGQTRLNGRRELAAIDGLEGDVTNGTLEQSTTAVLDKISGAVLIGARQREARGHLLTGVVEQLLLENKRARDTDAAAMNMQIVAWRDRRAANEALVAGSGDALRTWRQP